MWKMGIGCLAVGLACFGSTSAAAATSASASFSGLTFTLVDLDADDGVDAALSWGTPAGFSQVDQRFGQGFEQVPQSGGGSAWAVTFAQAAADTGSSSSDFSSSAVLSGGRADTIGDRLSAQAVTVGGQQYDVLAYMTGDFVLSANTELRVTGLAQSSIFGSDSSGFAAPDGVALAGEETFSVARTYLDLYLSGLTFNQALNGQNLLPASRLTGGYADSARSEFSLILRNDQGTAFDGYFSAIAQSSVSQLTSTSVTPAVPEPASWMLFACGLLALSAARLHGNRR